MMNKFAERLQEEVEHSEWLTDRLKCVAKSIENLGVEQPIQCLFGYGICGYPIDDCHNCPRHDWNLCYMPLTYARLGDE